MYGSVRRYSSRSIALISALLLASNPLIFAQSTYAYTNLPYTLYIVSGTIYIYLWAKENNKGYLILGALLTGLSTWARSVEPFWLTNLLFVVVVSLYKKRYHSLILYPAVFLAIQFPWRVFQKIVNKVPYTTEQIGTTTSILFNNIDIGRAGIILSYLYSSVFATWGIGAIFFIFVILLNIFNNRWKVNIEFLLIILGNVLLLFLGTYILSYSTVHWDLIPDSVKRMSMFFMPMFYFYIFSGQAFGKFQAEEQKSK